MATATDVPLELHDLIIDHLHGQKRDLGTCGLLCKAWLPSSRRHLFASVTLHKNNWPEFFRLLESPLATFTEFINSLEVLQTGHDENFNEVIARLPPIAATSLQLSWVCFQDIDIDQHDFATPYQVALLVSNFPWLEKLSVDTMFLENYVVQKVVPPEVPRNLKFVRFRCPPGNEPSTAYFLSWLHAVERPLSIRCLQLNSLGTESLLPATDINTHIDLSQTTCLQTLTVHLHLNWAHFDIHGAPAWGVLSCLHAKITTLNIVLAAYDVDMLNKLDWVYLTTALRTHRQLSSLERLHFMVQAALAMDEIEAAIRARLPEHNARGIVEVSADRFY
ncbi:hypothetical protein C8R44DRAFT_881067 [Mycena epipterygia]|nr:hypothetical protein C8R44DRAFT_881067 [Mycena epipterygia]